jgi:signal transduction histidine kinase
MQNKMKMPTGEAVKLPADEPAPPAWRLRLELSSNPARSIDVDLGEEIILGANNGDGVIDLSPFDAAGMGVSRRHLRLWPADDGLNVLDLDSTNGTLINGLALRARTPCKIADGDQLTLGKLDLVLRVVRDPHDRTQELRQQADLADALVQMGKAITSQLDLDAVLSRALEMAMSLTSAGEAAVWLVDEQTNELFLEAARGIKDDQIRRMRLPVTDSLVGKVIETARPLRISRGQTGTPVKVKTGYIVDALLYVPLIHAGTTFGVMATTHRDPGKDFSPRDEKLLAALADFVAIAVQNARLYRRLQEADRLKGEMIQNIAHEFRTPLQYIVGYVDLLLDGRESMPPEQVKSLQIMSRQADRLTWLVENFVALQTAEDIAAKRMPTDIRMLLAGALESAKVLAAEKEISMTLQVEDNLPDVMINPMTVFQLLDNLVSNALKFTPKGGTIELSARLAESGDKAHIAVRDTGIGIPAEMQERIFERFFQLDGSTTRRFEGIGLGLAVCKAVLDAHGERIWVESEPGKGSTFTFSLPVVRVESIKSGSKPPAAADNAG